MSRRSTEIRRIRLMGSAALALGGLLLGTAGAQAQVQAQSDTSEEVIEQIVVTGSRIKRAGFDTVQPAVVLDGSFIDDRGFTNLNQALDEVPAFGLSLNTQGDSNSQSIGLQFANAFNLGTARTLTLIDGRRVVTSNAPTTVENSAGAGLQVDLNTIPTALIDRVETVFTGGAPIYGSDAIAGTVNIILKRDFEGFIVDAQYDIDQRGDQEDFRVRAVWGVNSPNGRGNIMTSLEYVTNGGVRTDENDIVRRSSAFCEAPGSGFTFTLAADCNNLFTTPNTGLPVLLDDPTVVTTALFTNDFARALKDEDGNPLVFDTMGNLITFQQANMGTPLGNTTRTIGANGFVNPIVSDVQLFNALRNPTDRWNIYTKGHYEIADNLEVFFEGQYSRLEATELINQPRFFTDAFGNNQLRPGIVINTAENAFVSDQLRQTLIANGAFDPNLLDGDGELVPQFFKLNRSNIDIEGDTPFFRNQDVFRIVAGFEGSIDFAGRAWDWNTAFIYGESNATSRQDQIDAERLAFALDAIVDPETGNPACRVSVEGFPTAFDPVFPGSGRNTAINGCIPFNPFGLNPLTPEQQEFLIQPEFRQTEMRQLIYEGNISGELFDLPAGPMSIAGGFTHRRERGEFNGDRSARNALSENGPVRDVLGKFNTTEFYGETLVPLIRDGEGMPFDMPFIRTLEVEGALRSVDNSIAGRDVTWTAGGRLRLDLPGLEDSLLLRGNFTRAIRSPAIVELFFPESTTRVFANDPCDTRFIDSGPNPAQRRANCQAAIPAGVDLSTFSSLIVNSRREAITGGNPNLNNEKSDAWTVGAVFTPNFLPGFTLSVDWTDITINDAIVNLSLTAIMNACLDSSNFPNAAPCQAFGRDAEFQVINPRTGFVNAAQRSFAALMSTVNYDFPASDLPFGDNLPGSFSIFGNFFHVAKHEQEIGVGDLDIFAGERFDERFQYQLNLRYNLDRLMFLWQVRHIGSHVINKQEADGVRPPEFRKVSPMRIYNTTLSYQITDNLAGRFVVNNIFDNRDDPLRAAASGGNALNFTDAIGRRFQFALSLGF